MDTVIAFMFIALLINTILFFVHLMGYPRTDVFRLPYKAHGYALRTMFVRAIPGLAYEFLHMSDIHEDFHPIWQRVQHRLDAGRTNAGEIIAERSLLYDLLRHAPDPDDDRVGQQVADSRHRLETLRLLDNERGSAVFLASRRADIAQQQARLADSLRIEAEVLGAQRADTPAIPQPAWRRWAVKALSRIAQSGS